MRSSDYKYCPRCKASLKKRAGAFECPACGMTLYMNSAPTAAVLILGDNRVLLAQRGVEPFQGMFDIVGGFLEYGENPLEAVRREAREETGLRVKVLDFLGAYTDTYGAGGKSTLNLYYVGSIIGGRMRAGDDVAALRWFPLDRAPRLAFRSQALAMRQLRKWVRQHAST